MLMSERAPVRTYLSAQAKPKSPVFTHAVWWDRHRRRLVAVMGGSGGAGHLPPPHPQHPLQKNTNTDEPFDLTLPRFKRDLPLNRSHNPPFTLQHSSSLPSLLLVSLYFHLKSHYLCPLFFHLWSVRQQMRQNGRCRGGVKWGNNHSKRSGSAVYGNSRWDGRISFSSHCVQGLARLLRRFKCLMWKP